MFCVIPVGICVTGGAAMTCGAGDIDARIGCWELYNSSRVKAFI